MEGGALTFVLNKLDSLLRDELQHLGSVRADFEYIRAELGSMTAFLGVADAVEQGDPEIKVWVEQVREVAYDAEDVIDEFMLHFTHQHRHGISGKLHKISRSIKTSKYRHQIASEIQGIKSRVCTISERHKRNCDLNVQRASSSTGASDAWHDYREDALLLEEDEVVGIDEPREQLVRWLVEGDSILTVISVVGMGGLGKTTLAKKVYDDTRVKNHFKNYAWITVSESFKIEDLLTDMIQQLYGETKQAVPEGVEKMTRYKLKMIIKEFLSQNTYLLVFDDVWSIDAWNSIKAALPRGKGGRVMLTTRDADIASTSSGEFKGHVYELNFLSHEKSLILFCRKTFQQDSCPPDLKNVSLSILEKCEGLPLAIVAISGVLATKVKRRTHEWEMVRSSLGAEIEANNKLDKLKKVLSLSYNDLPYHLKTCFLYFSIFPKDHHIEQMRLIRLWIAEGFVKARQGRTLEEVAEDYLSELLNRSLIQVAETTIDGRVKACRMHDLLREIIILKSRDQNFATIAKEQDVMWPEKVRRLSVVSKLQNVQKNLTVSQLRSLHMFEVEDSLSKSFLRTLFPGGFRILKVLDLQGADLEVFPEEVVQLFHLRYLSLRDTKVMKIPGSIKKLKNLETLDLKHAHVTKLPVEILNLQRLRHLMVYCYESESYTNFHSKFGFEGLAKIGSLQSLQKLSYIEVTRGSIATELGKLNQLRRLSILKLREEDGKPLCSAIEKMSCLRSLSITSAEENEVIDLQYLSPPQFLQRLYLKGRLEELPKWIPSLDSLVRLYLKWSQLGDDPLEHLQELHNLVHLELHQAYNGETLCFKAGGFGRLKLLGLVQFDRLRHVEMENGALPNLEKLIIQHCGQLQKVPSGVEHLTKLNVLEFFDMPDGFIKTLHPREQGEDFLKVAHIPEVYSSKRIGGSWDSERLSERESSSLSSTVLRSHELRYCWK